MDTPVFIFAKDGKVRALSINDAMDLKLNEKGWKHTATVEATSWIEYYLNADIKEIKQQFKELKNEY